MLDLIFTIALSAALIGAGAVAIAILPWTEEELDRTEAELKALAGRLGAPRQSIARAA